jgi:hypothetical protein
MDADAPWSRRIASLAAVASLTAATVAVIATASRVFARGSVRDASPTEITLTRRGLPPGPSALLREVDRGLKGLKTGRIAFNAPRELGLHDSAIIRLDLSRRKKLSALLAEIEEIGDKRGAVIRVSREMEAHLAGLSFEIAPIIPEHQLVSERENTTWEWEVRPTATGTHRLHLAMLVFLDVNDRGTPRAIGTYDAIIEVRVGLLERTSGFVERNWQWLWVAILAPVAGWFFRRRKATAA